MLGVEFATMSFPRLRGSLNSSDFYVAGAWQTLCIKAHSFHICVRVRACMHARVHVCVCVCAHVEARYQGRTSLSIISHLSFEARSLI